MNALPVRIDPLAADDIRGLPVDLRPAVLEHLARVGANHGTCSRPTAFPHPPGLESGLWLRRSGGGVALLKVLFFLTASPDGIMVRRVLVSDHDRLPDWVLRPDEWFQDPPWPVIDV